MAFDLSQLVPGILPEQKGLLPIWQLIVAVGAVGNTVQAFAGTEVTRKLYTLKPGLVTPLSSRSFGVWTLTSGMVRFHAAYHLNEKTVYDITMWTYVFVIGHFVLEALVFRTATMKGPVAAPLIVASASLVWMFLQYDFYVQR